MKVRFRTSAPKLPQLLLAAMFVLAVPAARAAQGKALEPVTVKVVDSNRNVPVREFEYGYSVDRGRRSGWIANGSTNGTFVVQVPQSCELTVFIRAREFEARQDVYRTFPIKSSDTNREVVFKLDRGVVIRGVVRDARTKQPVSEARVAPIVFMPPLFTPDWGLAVTTSLSGKFELQVRMYEGVGVSHPDYLRVEQRSLGTNSSLYIPPESVVEGDVLLEKGEQFRGRVVDSTGTGVADVIVSDGAGKVVRTDKKGAFTLGSPRKWWGHNDAYAFEFEKEGFLTLQIHPTNAPNNEMQIVLPSLPILRGEVRGADGKPIADFNVIAGPGLNPADYECTREHVRNGRGEFTLKLKSALEETNWICVTAPGHAFSETLVTTGQLARTLTIQMDRGVVVKGMLASADGVPGGNKMILVPARRKPEFSNEDGAAAKFARLNTSVNRDGTFQFQDVLPGDYFLRLTDNRNVRKEWMLTVAAHDHDVGKISAGSSTRAGTGRLVGQVFHPPQTRRRHVGLC